MRATYKIPVLCGIGGMLEFYDFILYILFAEQIQSVFFTGVTSVFVQNLLVVAVFSVAYVVRPLGGVVLGLFGDKFGRKRTFTFSIILMGVCCFFMGIMPGYQQIGIAAPLLFILLRILQGFALGGELPGAIVFVYESLETRRGLGLGILFSMIFFGFLLGYVMKTFLLSVFAQHAWRAGFISGSLVAWLGFYLRNTLSETLLFLRMHADRETFPLRVLLSNPVHRRALLGGILVTITVAFSGVVVALYMTHYLISTLHHSPAVASLVMTQVTLISPLLVGGSGWLSDYVGYKKILAVSCGVLFCVSIPAFYLLKHGHLLAGVLLLDSPCLFICGAFMWLLNEIFPTVIRFTGVAACYNIAFAAVGGVAPVLLECLIAKFDPFLGPGLFAMLCAVLSLSGLILVRRYAGNTHALPGMPA